MSEKNKDVPGAPGDDHARRRLEEMLAQRLPQESQDTAGDETAGEEADPDSGWPQDDVTRPDEPPNQPDDDDDQAADRTDDALPLGEHEPEDEERGDEDRD